MSKEVKRIDICIVYDGESRDIKAVPKQDGRFILYTDHESTRQALADTKAQLEALEDILLAFDNCRFLSDEQNEAHYRALQNSRARNKT